MLRRFQVTAGLSQEALGERAGLSADAVAALERGRRSGRGFTLGVLAEALALGAEDRALLVSAAAGGQPARTAGSAAAGPADQFCRPPARLAEVERRVGQARMLTLLGPGGTGKTRLALVVAERHAGGRCSRPWTPAWSRSWLSTPSRPR